MHTQEQENYGFLYVPFSMRVDPRKVYARPRPINLNKKFEPVY